MTGPISKAEDTLMWQSFYLMLLVAVPVILLTLFFAWRYRASGSASDYRPDWDRSRIVELSVWGVPAIMIAILGTWVWDKTHALDPYKPLPGGDPLIIEAIAMDWKWLFLYPEQNIGTINEVAFPVGRPVSFRITSEVAMNSFMIPALGGQIYAMAGMETQLNLKADDVGSTLGRNMQFTGDGFAGQKFEAVSMSESAFTAWVDKVRQSRETLDEETFAEVSEPSVNASVRYFAGVPSGLFERRIEHFSGMSHGHSAPTEAADR